MLAGGLGSRSSPDASGAIIRLQTEGLPSAAQNVALSIRKCHFFYGVVMAVDRNIIKTLISNYEQDIRGNVYSFRLSDGENISFSIDEKDVPHLMGIRKLPLRQVQNKSATAVYKMLKDGRISVDHIEPYKESYKKVMNFSHLVSILHCGDAVKIVKKIGSIKSSYIFYLDHRPHEIIHLGIIRDGDNWHPETLLVNQRRNVTAYIDGQMPVDILSMNITQKE